MRVRSYVTFQVFHLSMHRPQMYTAGLLKHVFKAPGTNGHPPLPPVVLQSCVPSVSISVSLSLSRARLTGHLSLS